MIKAIIILAILLLIKMIISEFVEYRKLENQMLKDKIERLEEKIKHLSNKI